MLQSVVNRGVEDRPGLHVELNAPEFSKRKDFMEYVEKQPVFTWHKPGKDPDEWSDVAVLVEPILSGEGDSEDIPPDTWNTILAALRAKFGQQGEGIPPYAKERHIVVRLTNL